jgi:hypothetical protein
MPGNVLTASVVARRRKRAKRYLAAADEEATAADWPNPA